MRDAIARTAGVAAPAAAVLLFTYLAAVAILYLFFPSFIDQGEASVAMLALDLKSGHPIYHALDAAPRTSLLYGPSMYLVHSVLLTVIDNPILATKVAGVMLCLFGVALGLAALRRVIRGPWFWMASLHAGLVLLSFSNVSFWNRSDSLILFCVSAVAVAGPHAARGRHRFAAGLAIALALALATNAKVHGAVYAAPVLFVHLRNAGWRQIQGIASATAAFTMAPFVLLPSWLPFSDYRSWLMVAANHPRDMALLRECVILLIQICAPVIAVALVAWRGRPAEWKAALLVLLGSGALVCAIAAKAGAGAPHLLPFAFPAAWIAARGLQDAISRPSRVGIALAASLVLLSTFALGRRALLNQQFVVTSGLAAGEWRAMREASTEIRQFLAKYPAASFAMGYGDSERADRAYRLSYLKPLLFAHGKMNFIDAAALMDMQAGGVPMPQATIDRLHSQRIDIFLTPADGIPFAKKSYYGGRDLFGEDFRQAFEANYVRHDAGSHFAVWVSKRFAGVASAGASQRNNDNTR